MARDSGGALAPSDPITDGQSSDTDLRSELLGLLGRSANDGGRLDAELRELAKSYHQHVYRELMRQLTSIELDAEECAGSWRAIVAHQRSMQERLGQAVDVRVAMLDWFIESRALKDPTIVELATFEQLRASVHRDGLTDLHNFRFFNEHLRREMAKSSRVLAPLSLVMIDVDDFKDYNDRHGHEAGNEVLVTVARALSESLREADICARYGGEEFALVLADTPKADARDVAERARQRVAERCAGLVASQSDTPPTISVGVATCPADATEPGTLIRHADEALYAAKSAGKNQVRVYGDVTRSFRRTDVELSGHLRTLESSYEPVGASSVGDGGFRIQVEREIPEGSLLEIRLSLPNHEQGLTATGRVAYLRPTTEGAFEAGIELTEIGREDRLTLTRLLDRSRGEAPDEPDE